MIVVWLFLAVSRVCQQFVIVVFPDHTHLLFLFKKVGCSSFIVFLGHVAVIVHCLFSQRVVGWCVIVTFPGHTYLLFIV